MVEISVQMLEFKEAVRHTWNSCFTRSAEPMSAETQEAFSDIERALLRVLVLGPHGMGDIADEYRVRVLHEILVQPMYEPGELPIRFGTREPNGTLAWDEEATVKVDASTQFHFYDFFDWYPYGYVDLPFVRVRTPASLDGSSGKIALIEQRHCKFILNESTADPV